MLAGEAALLPVRDAWWYVPRRPLGGGGKASQGEAFFIAPNPPFGAVFTYYLRDALKTRKEQRREREKAIEKAGGDTPYPGWDALREEQLEDDPAIVLTVRDADGAVVRRVTGPVGAGFHRVAWDLRYPPSDPGPEEWQRGDSLLAPPGTYTVSLSRRVDGEQTDLGEPQTFELVPLREGTLPGSPPEVAAAFWRELEQLRHAVKAAGKVIDDTAERIAAVRAALDRSSADDASLDEQARAMAVQLDGLRRTLDGDRRRAMMGDPGPVSIERRLDVAMTGNELSTYGPTPTHRRSVEIARKQFAGLREALDRMLSEELPALEVKLDAAGVPWTPGRALPRAAPAGG
jgi:hypothetical protein